MVAQRGGELQGYRPGSDSETLQQQMLFASSQQDPIQTLETEPNFDLLGNVDTIRGLPVSYSIGGLPNSFL
jgi:hypothetical protein